MTWWWSLWSDHGDLTKFSMRKLISDTIWWSAMLSGRCLSLFLPSFWNPIGLTDRFIRVRHLDFDYFPYWLATNRDHFISSDDNDKDQNYRIRKIIIWQKWMVYQSAISIVNRVRAWPYFLIFAVEWVVEGLMIELRNWWRVDQYSWNPWRPMIWSVYAER